MLCDLHREKPSLGIRSLQAEGYWFGREFLLDLVGGLADSNSLWILVEYSIPLACERIGWVRVENAV